MANRILVPLDGSPLAETVLEPATSCTLSLMQGVEQAIRSPRGSTSCLIHLVLVVRPIDSLAENRPEALLVSGAEPTGKLELHRVAGDTSAAED